MVEAPRSNPQTPELLEGGAPPSPDLEVLLHRILEQAVDDSVPSKSSADDVGSRQEVVLAVEVDGVRYKLMRNSAQVDRAPVTLSPREREIVRLIAKGLPNKAIAA